MPSHTRPSFDRRSGEDRRKAYTEGYFLAGGIERRSGKERRQPNERRKGWVRITKWSSIKKELLNADFQLSDD
jgi:hypothetical protein